MAFYFGSDPMPMISRRINPPALFAFLIAIVLTSTGAPRKKAKPKKAPPTINLHAETIAKAVPKFNPQGNRATAEEQMKQLIHLIAKTNRDNLSSNSSLVRTAMDFRKDIGEHQRTISMGAIVKAWDTAHAYGAISGGHHFYGQATKGRFAGEELVFENIVPPGKLPECKGYIGNLRLVPASQAWKQGTPIDKKDEAYANGLKQVIHEATNLAKMREIQKSKVGHLALSKEEVERRWQAQVAATGDAYKQPPNLRLHAQKMGTPSKLNGNRYKLRVEVTNISRHPTEVEIVSTIVGYSENDNKIYELRRDKRVLKLRRSQVDAYLIQTPNVNVFKKPLIKFDPKRSQKVIYRGHTIVAKFDGEVIGTLGSDARLAQVASGDYMAPTMITKVSRMGGPPPPAPSASGSSFELVKFASPSDLAAGKDGEVMGPGPSDTIDLMADENRMYRLDSDGILWIYEHPSFNASAEQLGDIFAGPLVHSLFSDGTYYYLHLSQDAASYGENDVVQFSSLGDLISGYNGDVLGQAAPGSASFMADGESYFKVHHGNVQEAVLSSKDLAPIIANTKPNYKTEGKLFCGTKHKGVFSDGTHYYLLVASEAVQ